MREIKFRAWDVLHKRMCKVDRIDFVDPEIQLRWKNKKGDWVVRWFKRDKWIKEMQYTDLKDSRNVEIYEGDIIRYWDVPWNTAGLGADWKYIVVKYERCGFNLPDIDLEVIGNIYENPELDIP